MNQGFHERLNQLLAAGDPFVAVTVVDVAGSVPQDRGAKMLVTAKGLDFGTVGGGRIETKAIAEARRMLELSDAAATRFVDWNLIKDVGMTCGGRMRLYFERHNHAAWPIVIFGAGTSPTPSPACSSGSTAGSLATTPAASGLTGCLNRRG